MKEKNFLQLQAYDYIKERILSGELAQGTLYSETRLSAEIGISRTPMREALQCLSQDGYITIVPSKGFMIRQLNEKDMQESIQVRCAIEGYCTYVISSEIHTEKGQQLLKELSEILQKMRESLNCNDDYSTFIHYDHQFHLLLVNYLHNDEFNQIFQRLMYLIKLTSQSALSVEGRAFGTLKEHQDFYDALQAGDIHAACNLIFSHLNMPLNITAR